MEGHVKLLAILYMVFGVLGALAALVILMVFGGVAGIIGAATGGSPDARIAIPIVGVIGGLIFVLVLILSVPCIAAGIGLMNYREWGRILALVLSILNLFNIPFGTVLGVYGLWVLLNQQTVALFQRPIATAAR